MNKKAARDAILNIFNALKTPTPSQRYLRSLQSGKLYELVCLAELLKELKSKYGFRPRFVGTKVVFKGGAGAIKHSDGHFEFKGASGKTYKVFVDIVFKTLGSSAPGYGGDLSDYHELDLVIVEQHVTGTPSHMDLVLGVECKSNAYFEKFLVKQALGVRREMGMLTPLQQSDLSADALKSHTEWANSNPASEFWFAYLHSKGNLYSKSPECFGIKFRHWLV